MAIEIQFSKSDINTPWGFRLTGGAECDVPLTVIKVKLFVFVFWFLTS